MDNTEAVRVEQDGASVRLAVSVPADAVQSAEVRLKQELRRSVHVPGFRPGKAPFHLVLARYGEPEYEADLKEILLKEWLNKALDDHSLRPASTPEVEVLSFQPGEKLEFQASFEVFPQVEVPDTPKVQLAEPPAPKVSEQEIDEVLHDLRRRSAALRAREAPAQAGDVVRISRGGHTWEAEVDQQAELGAQLVGAEAGHDVVLKHEGSEESFSVEGVYEVLLPDREEVAQQYGKDAWDELRGEVETELLKQSQRDAEQRRRGEALDALADSLGVEPPPGLLAKLVEEEVARFGGKQELRGEIENAVRRRLRRELIARMVCEQKGLLPTEQEVLSQAEKTDREPDSVRIQLLITRAADWVLENKATGGN